MDTTTSENATLSQPEVEVAMARLTDGEKTALMKIAMLYARKTPYDHQDLVQEAFTRILGGRRVWPRDANTSLFLGGVIRSIAWEWKRERPFEIIGATDVTVEERNANAAIDATRIVLLFDDDTVAKKNGHRHDGRCERRGIAVRQRTWQDGIRKQADKDPPPH